MTKKLEEKVDGPAWMFSMAPIYLRQAFVLADALHAKKAGMLSFIDGSETIGKASACVILCVCAVEAQATEMFTEIGRDRHLNDEIIAAIIDGDKGIVEKINSLKGPVGLKPLNKGAGATQKFQLLCKLRNELVHYKSHYSDKKDSAQNKIEQHLKQVFKPNPDQAGLPYFPAGWASAENATLAIKIAVDFIIEFTSDSPISEQVAGYNQFIRQN